MGGLGDQLKTWMKENNIEKIPVYAESGSWTVINRRIKRLDHIDKKLFSPNVKFSAEGKISITPFRLVHSIQPGFPAVGFRFKDVVYSEDVGKIPEASEKHYKNADIIIFDAAMWFDRIIKGHYNVEMALEEAKKYKPDLFVITQAGHTYPPQESAEKQIQAYWDRVRGDIKTRVKLAYDGLTLESKSSVSVNLVEDKDGIYFVKPHGNMIWDGRKSLIVKSKLFRSAIGKIFYLLEGDLAYGLIKIKAPYKINLKEFEKLKEKHRVSDEERKKWWPNKKVLFAYPFEKIKMFKNPKKVKIPKGVQVFVKDFKFLIQEMIAEREEKMSEIDLNSYKLLDDFKDMTIIKDFISIIGSYAEQKDGYKPNDIDLLVRMSEPSSFIKRAVEVRILKTLDWPENWSEKIHFVWGDTEGPHDTFIPMYDLVLKRQLPMKKIEMLDNQKKKWVCPEEYGKLSPNIDFYPMKPAKRFYKINEALEYMFTIADKFAIEKKINGFRGVLERKGDSIKVFSDEKRDISRNFKTIISQADDLSSKDFILDGELVLKGGGRAEIAKYVTGKGELDDSDIEFQAFDILKFDEDVTKKPWHERKSLLHNLNFTKNIKEVRSIIVNSPDKARKAIDLMKNLPKSEGAMIKKYDGTYTKGKTTHAKSTAWIKFRIEDPIDVMILEVLKKENGYSYTIGIHIKDDKNKFHPKYVVDTTHGPVLLLGNTFVTKQKFNKHDHITVNVEEVWRHTYTKEDKIRYSIHKPTVIKSAKGTSTWKYLDDLAPNITINSPEENHIYGYIAPEYNITINDV